MPSGWKYLKRMLCGETPAQILQTMPDEDFDRVRQASAQIALPRQQRRKLQRDLSKIKR